MRTHTEVPRVRRSMLIVLTVLTPSLAFSQTPGPGRQVFATRCAACHGTEGAGGELGPSIVARIPLRSDQDLEAVIKDGLPGAGMPAFASLSRTEVTDLIAHLRTLRPRAGGPKRADVALTDGRKLAGTV